MAREQYIFETNTINGGFLVDRRTNQIVGTTANGVDQYFVTGDRNPVCTGISTTEWHLFQKSARSRGLFYANYVTRAKVCPIAVP